MQDFGGAGEVAVVAAVEAFPTDLILSEIKKLQVDEKDMGGRLSAIFGQLEGLTSQLLENIDVEDLNVRHLPGLLKGLKDMCECVLALNESVYGLEGIVDAVNKIEAAGSQADQP